MSARLVVLSILQMAAGCAIAAFLVGMLGKHYWFFDLFAHFRVQYIVVLLICGLASLLLGYYKVAFTNLLAGGLLSLTLWPFTLPSSPQNGPGLKVLSYNVYTGNTKSAEVLDFLKSEDADVVFLMETNRRWLRDLEPLFANYPHRLESPREDNFGMALLSKLPFDKSEILNFGAHDLPAADITVSKEAQVYRILCIHVLPPVSAEATADRNQHLLEASERLGNDAAQHRLLIGDFNLTPYSPWFGEILRQGKLQNISPGYFPTWRTSEPPLAIPIDHILTSPSLTVRSRKLGPSLGSDHNALIAEVAPAAK